MSKRRVASMLTDYIQGSCDCKKCHDQAMAELRALLRVAKAARPFAEEPTHPVGLELHRALAALDRVSGGGK